MFKIIKRMFPESESFTTVFDELTHDEAEELLSMLQNMPIYADRKFEIIEY